MTLQGGASGISPSISPPYVAPPPPGASPAPLLAEHEHHLWGLQFLSLC